MNNDLTFELKRQAFHFLLGTTIAAAVYFLKPAYGTLVAVPILLGVAVMLVIPKIRIQLHLSEKLLYHFEREQDKKTFPYKGAILFGLGVTPPILFLPTALAAATIITLSVGDSFSTIIGKTYGKHKIGRKSVEGAIGFAVTAFLAANLFTNPTAAARLALIGAIIELDHKIDDNISIPWGLTILYYLIPTLF